MQHVKITIESLADVKAGKKLINTEKENIEEAEAFEVAIQEAGMVSGKTSVMFILKMKDSRYKIAQVSAETLEIIAGAVKGAQLRFRDQEKA